MCWGGTCGMKRAAKRREKDRIASQAIETRQVRRARERKERGE
jgi:hypothetical protein